MTRPIFEADPTPSPDASPDSGEARQHARWLEAIAKDMDFKGDGDWAEKTRAVARFLTRPSPSPAIVKEAGEVERAHLAAWRAIYGDGDPFLNPEGFDYCCKIADAVLAALSASNAAQVSK